MKNLSYELKMEILKQYLIEYQGYTEEEFLDHRDQWLDDVLIVNEEGREEECKEYQNNLIDDIGINGFSENFKEWIYNNAINKEWFDNVLKEMMESYIEDIKYEDGRLDEEMEESGVTTEDEFLDYLIENSGDSIQYFIDTFGKEEFKEVIEKNDLVDREKVIEEIKEWDGYSCLASYDGVEHEYYINGELYFLYRQN